MTRAGPGHLARVRFRSVYVDRVSMPDAVDLIVRRARRGAGGLVITPNTSIARSLDVGDYAWLDRYCFLSLLDGAPLGWLLRLHGSGVLPRVTGSDLLPEVCEAVRATDLAFCVVGSGAEEFKERFSSPAMRILGADLPHLAAGDPGLAIAAVPHLPTGPGVVFVGLGFPKQEILAATLYEARPDLVYVCSGGAAEMASGVKRRSPEVFRRVGLEWMWRLALEPGRLSKRFLLEAGPWLVRSTLAEVFHRAPATQRTEQDERGHVDGSRIPLQGPANRADVRTADGRREVPPAARDETRPEAAV